MTLQAVQSRGLVEQVFGQLASGIMSGTYPVGSHLPSERALAEVLQVNRQVIREASRRLAQMGLVQVLHGDGTRVLDFRAHGGLDLLALLMEQAGSRKTSLRYWVPILEMRNALAPDVVRHCAKHAKQTLRDELVETAHKLSSAKDDAAIYVLESHFWDLVHEGADHIVYRLAYNSFKRCSSLINEESRAWVAMEVRHSGYRLELAKAIATGDGDRAEREARASMRSMLDTWVTQVEAQRVQRQRGPKPKTKASGRNGSSPTKASARPAKPAKTPARKAKPLASRV